MNNFRIKQYNSCNSENNVTNAGESFSSILHRQIDPFKKDQYAKDQIKDSLSNIMRTLHKTKIPQNGNLILMRMNKNVQNVMHT